jgi:hypothetical protein
MYGDIKTSGNNIQGHIVQDETYGDVSSLYQGKDASCEGAKCQLDAFKCLPLKLVK